MVSTDDIDDPVELAIVKYSLHPSIKRVTLILLKHLNFGLAPQRGQ